MTKTYADIIVDITSEKLDRSFQYLVPQHLEGRLQPGMQVQVPFGNGGRMIKGYVIRVTDQPSFDVSRMKEIRGVETGSNSIESRLIALAAWMREQYGATMIQALKTVLPVKQKMLAEFLEMDSNLMVNFHIQSIDQMKAIKLVKSKVTDLLFNILCLPHY